MDATRATFAAARFHAGGRAGTPSPIVRKDALRSRPRHQLRLPQLRRNLLRRAKNGEIRLSPSSSTGDAAADEELKVANSIYSRKMYDYAIMEYEKFLIAHPSSPGRDTAMFRLAESHRMLGNERAARSGYERLLQEFRQGEFAGAGAYRLGEYLYAEKKYDPALIQFRLAAAQSDNDEVRISAKYNLARCLDRLKRWDEAAKFYEEVAAIQKNNPYLHYARLSLAENAAAVGPAEGSARGFLGVSRAARLLPAVRAEAAVKAAALAAELGDKQRALKLFTEALASPESGDWKPTAFLGAIRLNFQLDAYKKVVEMSEKAPLGIPDDERAEILLLTGDSYPSAGKCPCGARVYDGFCFNSRTLRPRRVRGFHRLISMYQLDDPKLIQEADDFLKHSTDPLERAQVSLLKAEALVQTEEVCRGGADLRQAR